MSTRALQIAKQRNSVYSDIILSSPLERIQIVIRRGWIPSRSDTAFRQQLCCMETSHLNENLSDHKTNLQNAIQVLSDQRDTLSVSREAWIIANLVVAGVSAHSINVIDSLRGRFGKGERQRVISPIKYHFTSKHWNRLVACQLRWYLRDYNMKLLFVSIYGFSRVPRLTLICALALKHSRWNIKYLK